MKHLKLAKKNREIDTASWDKLYNNLVVKKIRAKYTVNDELAILRQRDTKPEEFDAYNAYVELCKTNVKAELDSKTD